MLVGASGRRVLKGFVLAIASVTVLAACATLYTTRHGSGRAAQSDDIYEAVIRYRAVHEFPKSKTFFVCIDGEDPRPELLRRFTTGGVTVRKWSDARGPERRGPPLALFGIKWISDSEVEVCSQSIFNQMMAVGMAHRLVRKGRHWVVVSANRRWVS